MASLAATVDDPLAALFEACGRDAVVTNPTERALLAHDIHAVGRTPLAVLRPPTLAQAAAGVGAATAQGLAVFPRGGGMSYTDGAIPTAERSVILDLTRLDRVVTIDARGLWATVEAGCTWARLDAALAPHGVRAAFWGPFSGHDATIGGSLSNGTATFGSGSVGTSGSAVLGFELALADGRVVRTGMDAQAGAQPFFDQYGPNLTQLFCNDGGALGVKLAATLPLVPRAEHVRGLSFVMPDFAAAAAALEAVGRAGLASEAFGVDSTVAAQFAGAPDFKRDLAMLFRIARGRGGLGRAARAAAGGRRLLRREGVHLHFVAEGRDASDLALKVAAIRALAKGSEVADTVPSAARAAPFSPLNATDHLGRRVLPIHGIVPYAASLSLDVAIGAVVEAARAEADAVGLFIARSYAGIGRNALLYEPVFYWPEELSPYQLSKTTSAARHPANPAARALVERLRGEMVAAMAAHGAAHLQIGRRYPWARGRDLTLVRAVKREVDPKGLLNPGVLGL